ncbi:MAG: recombinase family protein [Chloroflexi bacterium]|nr:recombinase family protein [Chloroflexota bacterium]
MKVALYARVSTVRQEQDETIASQLTSLEAYAAEHGYQIDDAHVYLDDGYSGARLERPGLDRLRDAAQGGLIDLVLVHSPDRLARDYVSQQVAIAELKRQGCAVEFVHGPTSDKPEDRLLLQMQGMFAEYERTLILERTRRGRLHKAQQGLLIAGRTPYGYRRIPARNGQPAYLEIHEPEAKTVRQMYHWLLVEGLSNRQIAKRLREQGVKAPYSDLWHADTVRNMLLNPVYGGTAYYNKKASVEPKNPRHPDTYRRRSKGSYQWRPQEEWIPISVPAIVGPEFCQEAAEQMHRNQQNSPRNTHYPYLLRNLVRCGECGLRMQAHCQRHSSSSGDVSFGYPYYRCYANDPLATRRPEICSARSIRADRLDQAVWIQVRELLLEPNRLVEQLGQLHNDAALEDGALRQQLDRLQRLLKQNLRQHERIVDAYQQGVIELDQLAARRDQLNRQKAQLQAQISQLQQDREARQRLVPALTAIEEFRAKIVAGLDAAEEDFDKRRQIVKLLIEDVVVTGGDVEIHYVVPLSGIYHLRQRHQRP